MKFPIREAWHRHRLDRSYLEAMRPSMYGCPKCGRRDGLNYEIDIDCNIDIDCRYKIKCENCGYEPEEWNENIADAVLIFDMEARNQPLLNNV